MRKINLIIIGIATVIAVSCTTDKKNELAKLKEEQANINEKIKTLQSQVNTSNGNEQPNDNIKLVGITEIKPSTFDHYIKVQGSLDGDQNISVFAEAPGTVISVKADVGQHVERGQVLAQIDDAQYQSQLQSLETQYSLALDVYEKQKRLWDQKIGSEIQFLQAKTNKESLEQQITSLKQQIEKFKIKSPITGTIEECNVKVGGAVSPDPRLIAFRVLAFSNLKVKAEVSEAYSSRVNEGDRITIIFPDIDKEVDSKINFVSNFINPTNRTFLIETKLPERVENLKANMVSVLKINDYHTDNAITLSMNVIQNDLNDDYVYVVKSNNGQYVVSKQIVNIGLSYNGIAQITNGLKLGDKVVTVGYQELTDGEQVRF